jgi:hypothetical protein
MDYLGKYLGLDEIWYTCDAAHREHQWVKVLSKARGAMVPLVGFGSSDCRCKSHLYYFISRPSGGNFRRKIHSGFDNHDRIYIVKPVPKVNFFTAYSPGSCFALYFPDALKGF